MKKFFLIAGETSGDLLGSKLMAQIKEINKDAKFFGVGGPLMKKQGLKTIFDYNDLAIMGFVEIIPQIPKILNRINLCVKEIININPDYVITIDSPDFSFRVVKKIKNKVNSKKIHLIAPSVWAYREKRAQKIAKLYDLLLTILPFEPPYFSKYGLKSVFIGHPITENKPDLATIKNINKEFRSKNKIDNNDKIILITPGSRISEVKKIYPEFIDTINILNETTNNITVTILVTPKTKKLVEEMSKNLKVRYFLIDNSKKEQALSSANFALAKSGTNNLEISLYQIPLIIAYKVNKLSYFLAKLLIKVKFVNLINILLNKKVISEMLQNDCQSNKLANEMQKLINNDKLQEQQISQANTALNLLGLNLKQEPSAIAAKEIIKL